MKLLVAVDGSDEAADALAYATDIADAMDGSITVVHAVDPAVYETADDDPVATSENASRRLIVQSIEDAEDRGFTILDEASSFAEELGYTVDTELVYGDPVTAISAYAEDADIDTIFVGHRGRSERTARMLGSIAQGLVERATMPVTVVR
ncbi:MAG: universal stress protein [Halobacteriales archaeon]